MARLCVRVAENDHPSDPSKNALRTHPGDVVALVEDSHVFSYAELNNGQYRIIDVPGVSVEELASLTQSQKDVGGEILKKRQYALDTTVLYTAWFGKTEATKAEVQAITIEKV